MILRKKYLIPFVVTIVFFLLFRFLFLDNIVKYGIEKTISLIPTLEVRISSLSMSLLRGKVELQEMMVYADNLNDVIVFNDVFIEINNNQILRGRFVINEMQVSGMNFVDKASVDWRRKDEKKRSGIGARIAGMVASYYSMERINERLELDKLFDIKINQFSDVLEKELQEIVSYYESMEKAFASDELEKKLKVLERKLRDLERNRPQDLKSLPGYLQEISSVRDEYEKVRKAYNEKQSALQQFKRRVDSAIKRVEEAAKFDLRTIDERLKSVQTKKESAVSDIVGEEVNNYLGILDKSVQVAKALRGDPRKRKPRRQFKGENIAFPVQDSFPVFYIKNVSIDGTDKQGNSFRGKAEDVTHRQNIRNVPSIVSFSQNLGSALSFMTVTVDLRDEVAFFADAFMKNHKLRDRYWDAEHLPLEINRGAFYVDMKAAYENNNFSSKVLVNTRGLEMSLHPAVNNKSWLERYFFESLSKMDHFQLDIRLDGSSLVINSNIDDVLAVASQRLLAAEVDRIDRIKDHYSEQWNSYVSEQIKKFKDEVNSLLL